MSTVLSFLKVLLNSRCLGVLGTWWEKSKGAAVADFHRLVISFLLGMFLLLPQHFSLFQTLVSLV
jgi:hypothetical protein